MLAFLRDHNDSQSVIDIFKRLYFELRPDRFCTLFKICLANNGTEFSSPKAVEYDRQGNLRTHIFYCDPSASYSQEDICLMDGSYQLLQLGKYWNKCPYDVFSFLYRQEIPDLPGCHKAPPRDVTLNRSIFHREGRHESG